MTTRQRILLSLSAAVALVGLVRCVGSDRGTTPVSQDAVARAPDAPDAAVVPPGSAAAAAAVAPDAAAATSTGGDVAAASGQLAWADAGSDAAAPVVDPRANPTATLMHGSDAPDRDFLADVERLTKKAPPPAAGELIAMHRQGATRPELEAFIKKSFGTQVALRTSAMRWLEQVAPSGRPTPSAAPSMTSTGEPNIKHPVRRADKP